MARRDNAQAPRVGLSRRAFFGVAAASAVGAGALTGGGAVPAFAQSGDARKRARYQRTEHVENFYRTNRYYDRGE